MINAIKAVLASTTDQLLDLEYVESLIKKFGLYYDARFIYGEPYNLWMNTHVNGGMYQQPRQIAQSLIYLHDKEIKSYLEIGAFFGYTFVFVTAYLSKFGLEEAIAFDTNKYINDFGEIEDCFRKLWISYLARPGSIEISGHPSKVGDIVGKRSFDLVFIDGNHAYSAVKEDYENVGKYARFCAFHDINDEACEDECEGGGPVQFWMELSYKHRFSGESTRCGNVDLCANGTKLIRYTYHPEGKRIMGIGIIEPGERS